MKDLLELHTGEIKWYVDKALEGLRDILPVYPISRGSRYFTGRYFNRSAKSFCRRAFQERFREFY